MFPQAVEALSEVNGHLFMALEDKLKKKKNRYRKQKKIPCVIVGSHISPE